MLPHVDIDPGTILIVASVIVAVSTNLRKTSLIYKEFVVSIK